uniref:Uncharacterized protein n=1 Tax=Aegilops tauschii subsp. strangulata TaxID=200361 RepID=A0A453AJ01_AEGTS
AQHLLYQHNYRTYILINMTDCIIIIFGTSYATECVSISSFRHLLIHSAINC